MHDGIHVYTRRNGGMLEHEVDHSNDIILTLIGPPVELHGWATPAMRVCETEHRARILVGCELNGTIVEANHGWRVEDSRLPVSR